MIFSGASVLTFKNYVLSGFWQNALAWTAFVLFLLIPVIALLTWLGHSRALLAIERQFFRALPASLLAALAVGGGAWLGASLLQAHGDIPALAGGIACAALGYGAVLLVFRGRLPLARA